MVRWLPALAGLCLAACTLSQPFGTECVSDQNCGCANCCISYRCTNLGPVVDPDAGTDGGEPAARWWLVSTFVGADAGTRDGVGTAAEFHSPVGLALDGAGNLFVADSDNNCVRRVDPQGQVTTLAAATAPCGGQGLSDPLGVAVDEHGNVYVADTGNNCVRVLAAGGSSFTPLAGSCSKQTAFCSDEPGLSRLSQPAGLAYRSPYLFVTESLGNAVRWVNVTNGLVGTLAGRSGSGTTPLADGTCSMGTMCGATNTSTFYVPLGIAVADDTTLLVADAQNCAARVISQAGGCLVSTTGHHDCPMFRQEETLNILVRPWGVAPTSSWADAGQLFVADTGNNRIATLDRLGALTNLAGDKEPGTVDGVGPDARFHTPTGLAVDAQGRVFVADTGNHRIRLLTLVPP